MSNAHLKPPFEAAWDAVTRSIRHHRRTRSTAIEDTRPRLTVQARVAEKYGKMAIGCDQCGQKGGSAGLPYQGLGNSKTAARRDGLGGTSR